MSTLLKKCLGETPEIKILCSTGSTQKKSQDIVLASTEVLPQAKLQFGLWKSAAIMFDILTTTLSVNYWLFLDLVKDFENTYVWFVSTSSL